MATIVWATTAPPGPRRRSTPRSSSASDVGDRAGRGLATAIQLPGRQRRRDGRTATRCARRSSSDGEAACAGVQAGVSAEISLVVERPAQALADSARSTKRE